VKSATLTSRVARVQTCVTAVALGVVAVGTSVAVRQLLTWKTDQHLESVMGRIGHYLDQAPPQSPDWAWLEYEVAEVRPHDVRVEIHDPAGQARIVVGPGSPLALLDVGCASQGNVRGCALRHGPYFIRATRDRSDDLAVSHQLTLALILACVAAAAVVALVSRAVMRRAVQPLSELEKRVSAIEPGTGQRVNLRSELLEIHNLAHRFDLLVERFEEALAREKRFTAEASHELRTPLTVARAEVEAIARNEHAPQALERALASLDGLGSLVEALLWFARAQSRVDDERMEIVNVADVVRSELRVLDRTHPGSSWLVELPDEALARGDEELLRRAAANLLDNAAKHGDGSHVEVCMSQARGSLELRVTNGGPVIPPELREDVFLPFVRAGSKLANRPGFGLGLPFARAVARAHGGDVRHGLALTSKTQMVLELPLVAWTNEPGTSEASVA
jgi:signal transduction histidine kinase